MRPPKPGSLLVIVLSCPQIGSLSSLTANQKAAQNNYWALGCQDLYYLNFGTCTILFQIVAKACAHDSRWLSDYYEIKISASSWLWECTWISMLTYQYMNVLCTFSRSNWFSFSLQFHNHALPTYNAHQQSYKFFWSIIVLKCTCKVFNLALCPFYCANSLGFIKIPHSI